MTRRTWPFVLAALLGCSADPATVPAVVTASAAGASAAAPDAASSSSAPVAAASADVEPPAPPPPSPPIELATGGKDAVHSSAGMVVSVEPNATRAGVSILEKGGNAVDAAVAVGYALAVTHPSAGNLGGGGFMIVKLRSGESFAIDFREVAPALATTEKVIAEVNAGAIGYASVAVPGTVAGLDLARDKFGKLPLSDLIAPAIKLAQGGHKISPRTGLSLKGQWEKLKKDAGARAIWGKKNGPLEAGDKVVQKDLAKTLRAIADKGDAGFYAGPVAEKIEAAMKKHGGDITRADLAGYKAKLREPLRFSYRGFTIETMPPPSMGGIAIAETLLQLERAGAHDSAMDSPDSYHLFVESAKRAYADRRIVGADPDFYGDRVPAGMTQRLLSGSYLVKRTPPIDRARATPASAIASGAVAKESSETTHFSVVDAEGNAVSCTVTLSASFGAKVVPPGTGVMFSNALGGFSASGPNDAAPGKRMASSMSPTIASRNGNVELVVGSPGGDTIPNTVTQVLQNLIDHRLPVDAAVKRGRIHHQLEPDVVRTEVGREPSDAAKKGLEAKGHKIAPSPIPLGDAKVIMRSPKTGESWAFSDAREGGLAAAQKPAKQKKSQN